MATSRTGADTAGALEHLADELARDADSFSPEVEPTPQDLPGRTRGAAPQPTERPTGAAAVLLDVGTSRRRGFTHVLWVAASAESVLGSPVFDSLGDRIAEVDGVGDVEWESIHHLHLNAPGREHDDVLREARAVVAGLLP